MKKESTSFLKKEAKNFYSLAARISPPAQCRLRETRRQGIKVFCFFFSKKKSFLSFLHVRSPSRRNLPGVSETYVFLPIQQLL